jgi:glycosyltransferase involved in cell wall biosynthesis
VSRPRVAFAVQRYGVEVNGGAELQARLLAELLNDDLDLTVLTTRALDYRTWADHYPAGEERVNGVRVLRFGVDVPRDEAAFDALSLRVLGGRERGPDAERRWMEAQGPRCSRLVAHLAEDPGRYAAVVFFTYLYAHTHDAMPLVADRALLVPELHEDPPLGLSIYDPVFAAPRRIVFNTQEERELARRRFGVEDARAEVVGLGVDPPPPDADPERFRLARGLVRPYALCLGRIDPSKGSAELIAHHEAYRATTPGGLDLVMLGRAVMPLPERPWLHAPGFVDEREKHDALAGASVVVLPSPYESLSIAMLEAWSHGVPTLANGASPVLVGQSRRSGGGIWYSDAAEYALGMRLLADNRPLAVALGHQGRRHVRERLGWPRIRAAWLEVLAEASPDRATPGPPGSTARA